MSTVVVAVFVGRVTFFFPGKVCQFGSFYLLETDEYFLLVVVGVGGVIQRKRKEENNRMSARRPKGLCGSGR